MKMKKNCMKRLLAALLCIAGAGLAFAKQESVKTEIASIDMHGNVNLAVGRSVFSAKGFGVSDAVTVKAGKFSFTGPVCRNYSDVDSGEYLVRINENADEVSLAINMGNFAKTAGVSVGDSVTITMKKKSGYLATYQSRLLRRSDTRSDYAADEVFANFRSVSARSIAAQRLFRSASPILADERAPYAARLMEEAGVRTVLNLASSAEDAAPLVAQVPYYHARAAEGSVAFLNMGVSFTDADFAAQLREGLAFMAEHDAPYLIHGKDGKNRTGFVCALLEAACGASLDEVTADYMQSYQNYYGIKQGSSQYTVIAQTVPDMFAAINGGKKVTDKNLRTVAEHYLLDTAGITPAQLEAIRGKLR